MIVNQVVKRGGSEKLIKRAEVTKITGSTTQYNLFSELSHQRSMGAFWVEIIFYLYRMRVHLSPLALLCFATCMAFLSQEKFQLFCFYSYFVCGEPIFPCFRHVSLYCHLRSPWRNICRSLDYNEPHHSLPPTNTVARLPTKCIRDGYCSVIALETRL
jgi:hypothetical protein